MSRPTWVSLAAIGIGNMLLRRIQAKKSWLGASVLDADGMLEEIESIIEYHAPKREPSDAVGQVHEIARLRRRLDDIKANTVIG